MILAIMLILAVPTLYLLSASLVFLNKDDGLYSLKYTRVSAALSILFVLFAIICAFVNEELKQKLEKKSEKYELVNEQFYRKIK